MNHHRQRLDVIFTIVWEAGWHVGSGQGTAAVDRLLRRRSCGPRGERALFVPGSQIKGVLRHHCERLAAVLGGNVVSPHIVGREPDGALLENFRPLAESGLLIDRLFGSRFQGDCLFVEDAVPAASGQQTTLLQSRTSIDRVSGTARDRALFVTEVAQPGGTELHSRLQARHPIGAITQDGDSFPFEYALLLAGLLSLEVLGGDKSTGLGKCRVKIAGETVRWNDRLDYSVTDALKGFEEAEWFEMLQLIRAEGKA